MGILSRTKAEPDEEISEVRSQYVKVLSQLSRVESQLAGLREERDNTREVNSLKRQITDLTIQKDKLEEDNARKLRKATQEAELQVQAATHEAGLLLKEREFDVESAKREAVLTVREGNLEAEQKRFKAEIAFQREHMQREVDRFDGIAKSLMERLPTINVELEGPASTAPRSPARRAPQKADD